MRIGRKIAFVGGGHITEMIIERLLRTGITIKGEIIVSDPRGERLESLFDKFEVNTSSDNTVAISQAEIVFICVLPQVVDEVISEFGSGMQLKRKVIVSIAAGIPISKYEVILNELPIVRALPNPPSRFGSGIIPVSFNNNVGDKDRADIMTLICSLGEYIEVEEKYINAVTSLSTPATVYYYIESLIEGGISSGLGRAEAEKIVFQTIKGSLDVWQYTGEKPSTLRDEAATPGGISIKCLDRLQSLNFRQAVIDSVVKGKERADLFSR